MLIAENTVRQLAINPDAQVPAYEPSKRALIIRCAGAFLRDQGIFDGDDGLADEVERRYRATQVLICRFVKIQFRARPNGFRWASLSAEDRYIMELFVEDFICLAISGGPRLPVERAVSSWMVRILLSIQIRNYMQGNRQNADLISAVAIPSFARLESLDLLSQTDFPVRNGTS